MLGHRILAASAVVIGLAFSTNTAHAAPIFLTPDVNFVTHGPTFSLSETGYSLSVDTTKGDFMTIDTGKGFSTLSGTLNASSASLVLTTGELQLSATEVSSRITTSMVGKDVFTIYKVTSSSIPGFNVGAQIGLDALVYNIDKSGNGQAKGDVAPVVPEPATLSLLLLGLGGMAGAVRRKVS